MGLARRGLAVLAMIIGGCEGTLDAGDPIRDAGVAVVDAPVDATPDTPAPPSCTAPTCTVRVQVRDARGAPVAAMVRAFHGETAKPEAGTTDASGEIALALPAGSYRFRAQRDGLPFWSGEADHCEVPRCTVVEIRIPDTSLERVVTWDPRLDGAYDGRGEISPPDPHLERDGVYLENWAIERYARPDVRLSSGHTHVFPQPWDDADPYGNPTEHEAQHAFGDTLQGIYVRFADRRRFDLVSIDYRARHDANPEHAATIQGADPANVEIWISDTLTPAATSWRRYSTGVPFQVEMTSWSSLFPHDVSDVAGVFITTTGNVSIDNVVLRPR